MQQAIQKLISVSENFVKFTRTHYGATREFDINGRRIWVYVVPNHSEVSCNGLEVAFHSTVHITFCNPKFISEEYINSTAKFLADRLSELKREEENKDKEERLKEILTEKEALELRLKEIDQLTKENA